MKNQRTAEKASDYISPRGTDLCVMCGTDTGIPTDTHINMRVGYVEGSGQCCNVCRLWDCGE